ncbi:MAG TPA: UvrD-helicase domain-containing protein, partial [Thermoguttaceae bacterium]|nr:UvrD-helicase domain-containing protein [Thermoguttaceae bacterium]
MPPRLRIIAGPPQSGKTAHLLARYRRSLGEDPPGAALWLTPTWRAAATVRDRLLSKECTACFSPGIMTFEKFADAVLEAAPEPVRPMSQLMKRQLVRQLLDEQLAGDRLKHFGPIARTGGLVDLVCELISELKRLEIWPEAFRRACEARGITDKDVELLEIYERYQQSLGEHQLYDAEGRFWEARHLLQQGQRRPLENLRLVVADGFTDFTHTQHEILSILGRRVDEMLVSLPLEPEPRRYDLFTKPIKTLADLQHWHRSVELVEFERTKSPPWPAMAHLERRLFTNPRQAVAAEDTSRVEILAAARPIGEIELIGARIKRLLGDGAARPGQIAVVFRTPQDTDSPVAEVFSAMGIPFTLELGQTLKRSPALAALIALLKLDAEDWPFVALSAVLGNNYFRPDWPEWQDGRIAMAAERVVRELQIPRGRRRLLRELREKSENNDGGESQYVAVLAALERLGGVLDELPKRAVPGDWAKAWQRLAEQTGLIRAIDQQGPTKRERDAASHVGLPDRAAWQRLMMLVGEGDCLARWLGQHPPEWDRLDALAALVDLLGSERIGHGGDETGHVRVLSAASVRAIAVPYLFLAGLSEKAFPPPDREDRLYGEAESQRLIAEGLPLVARTERNREEMLLFYEAMTRA